MVQAFSSNTVSLLSNITPNFGSNNAFIFFMMAMSYVGACDSCVVHFHAKGKLQQLHFNSYNNTSEFMRLQLDQQNGIGKDGGSIAIFDKLVTALY
jgi:hypothetical protein